MEILQRMCCGKHSDLNGKNLLMVECCASLQIVGVAAISWTSNSYRGFSVEKQIARENLTEEQFIVTQCLICDDVVVVSSVANSGIPL